MKYPSPNIYSSYTPPDHIFPKKVIQSRGFIKSNAMKYFFMRYGQLEKANFPIKTKENVVCGLLLVVSLILQYMNVELLPISL